MADVDPDVQLLVHLLATVDVIFSPFRHAPDNGKSAAATWEKRKAFRQNGLPLSGGGSAAQRQSHSRQLGRARKAGLVKITGRTRPKVRLTDRAEDALSSLTACYRCDEVWPLLALVANLTDQGLTNAGCVLETDILRSNYGNVTSADLGALELQSLPLLVRGWLRSNSDVEGRIGYAITSKGRSALATGPPQPAELPEYDHAAGDLFDAVFHTGLSERAGWQPENRSLIVIPLSAGCWPEKTEAAGDA